jgi:anti-sigma-K factor RskA
VQVNDIISSGLLELYAAGLASQEEAAQVQQWVQQYPEVADELAAIEAGIELYAQANAVQPDGSVKNKVFARINEDKEVKPFSALTSVAAEQNNVKVVSISSAWKKVAAASVLLLIASAIFNLIQFNRSNDIRNELAQSRQNVTLLAQENKQLQQDKEEMNAYAAAAGNKYSQAVSLNVSNAPDSSAKVFWMKNTGDVFVDPSNLPMLESNKQYELWAIVNGAPVNAGIIINTKKGIYRVQQMKSFGTVKVDAFAVSIEPKNISPAAKPTVVYAVGPVQ